MTTASVRKGKKVKFIIISGPFQFQVKIRWTSSLSFPSPRLHQVSYHIRMLSYSIYLFLFSFLLIFYFSYFQSFLFSIFHYEFDKYHTSDSSVASFELENLETSTSTSTSSESPLPLYWVSVVSLKKHHRSCNRDTRDCRDTVCDMWNPQSKVIQRWTHWVRTHQQSAEIAMIRHVIKFQMLELYR